MIELKKYLVSAAQVLQKYPSAYIWAKSLYYRRMPYKAVQLSCFAENRCSLELFDGFGPDVNEMEIEKLRTTINVGTERAMFSRAENTVTEFPYIPAASGVGRVLKIGRNVQGLGAGDLVVGSFRHSSRQTLNANQVYKLKSGIDLDDAALLHLALIALQGLRMGQVIPDMRVTIIGQGVIGRLATILARGVGANVKAVTHSRSKLDLFGETDGLALAEPEEREKFRTLNSDVVIDATGNEDVVGIAVEACREKGKVVLLGSNRGMTKNLDPTGLYRARQVSILGAHIRNIGEMPGSLGRNASAEMDFLQSLLIAGKVSFKSVITGKLSCSELEQSYPGVLNSKMPSCTVSINWSGHAGIQSALQRERFKVPEIKPIDVASKKQMAIVGCGGIGYVNAASIVASEGWKLGKVMDLNLESAEKLGAKFNAEAVSDFDSILNDRNIDAVMIAVPHSLHAELSIQALNAGKHVLVEKPLSTNLSEGMAMIKSAQENRRLLRTFYSMTYDEPKRTVKALVDKGVMGTIMGVAMEFHRYRPVNYWFVGSSSKSTPNWRGRKAMSGGGILIMNLVHNLDFFRQVVGLEIEDVFVNMKTMYHPIDVEDTFTMNFTGTRGELGTISAGSAVRGHGGSAIRMWGDAGQIVLDEKEVSFISNKAVGQYPSQKWHKISCMDNADFRAKFLDDFYQEIDAESVTDFSERGLLDMAIVEAAYRSAETRELVKSLDTLNTAFDIARSVEISQMDMPDMVESHE